MTTYRYTIILEREPDGGFHAYCPTLCLPAGRSRSWMRPASLSPAPVLSRNAYGPGRRPTARVRPQATGDVLPPGGAGRIDNALQKGRDLSNDGGDHMDETAMILEALAAFKNPRQEVFDRCQDLFLVLAGDTRPRC